ncbi:twin-arginine translocase TatA/TatE family subunit [Methanococcoides sp. SA1]|nr:twin-arginine translocase TatA/TatE family subunit [Methanococcoides sp. SA1]
MIGGLGSTELLLIFGLIVLLFGANKLPELARSMGTSMGEFKKAQKESEVSVKKAEKEILVSENASDEDDPGVKKLAEDLGINVESRTTEELLDEIRHSVKTTANKA